MTEPQSIEQALERAGVTGETLRDSERRALDVDGYVVLRGALDPDLVARLRDAFERTYLPSDQWPAPRASGARHALLDGEPDAWAAALSPRVLACAHHLLGRRFFLYDVQGREPRAGSGDQRLHRDWISPEGPAPMVIALAFLDPFDAANGATRVVPGSHLLPIASDAAYEHLLLHPDEVVVEGQAGDVLVLDGYLLHSGRRNVNGASRRNLQISLHAHGEDGYPVRPRPAAGASPEVRYLLGLPTT